MAIYTQNVNDVNSVKHTVFESSKIKATNTGHIHDVIVRDGSDNAIAVDNGVLVTLGEYTGDGLQTRYATVAGATPANPAIIGTVPLVKDAYNKEQEASYNFYNKAGAVARAYELDVNDIFAVSKEAVTGTITEGASVVWDNTNKNFKVAAKSATGFAGKVHSVVTGTFYDLVRIAVVQL